MSFLLLELQKRRIIFYMKTIELPSNKIEKEKSFLETLNLIIQISSKLETKSYVWGGLTQDIYEGNFLRDHDDIDCLMMNRNKFDGKVEKLFEQLGWEISDINGVLSIKKNGNKIHMGNIEAVDHEVAKYTLFDGSTNIAFPKNWLNDRPHMFYNLNVYTTTPEFEYAMRVYPKKINPKNEIREKDKKPIDYFEKILQEKYSNLDEVLAKMQFPSTLAQPDK